MPITNKNLVGTTQSGSGAYGSVPVVPDPSSSASTAITGDISNLADLYDLAKSVNQFNTGQALSQYQSNLPNYDAMVSQSSQNILNNLQGKISDDVVSQLTQNAAERGVATGLGTGSANYNTALLKALGLTSMGLQQTGENQLTSAVQRTPTSQLFNTSSFLVTPEQQQEAQMYANYYASMPNPTTAANTNLNNAYRGINAGLNSATSPNKSSGTTGTTGSTTGGRNFYGGEPASSTRTGRGSGTLSSYYTGNAPVTDQEIYDWLDQLPYTGGTGNVYADESSGSWLDDLLYGTGEFSGTGGYSGWGDYGDTGDYGYGDYAGLDMSNPETYDWNNYMTDYGYGDYADTGYEDYYYDW